MRKLSGKQQLALLIESTSPLQVRVMVQESEKFTSGFWHCNETCSSCVDTSLVTNKYTKELSFVHVQHTVLTISLYTHYIVIV